MALGDTGLAIGAVSRFLAAQLTAALSTQSPYFPTISIQRPQMDAGTVTQARLNLFLYEVQIDPAMRNIPLTPGRPTPLWVVLRYVMTAFDATGESDTDLAQDVLGMGMQFLMGLNSVLAGSLGVAALQDNPEPLKLTFDEGTPELLSRLMQGPDDKYRCSVPFQIRPVLIAPTDPPTGGTQLVGIDYLSSMTVGLSGIHNFVLPNLGPQVETAAPLAVALGDTLTLTGSNLDLPNLSVVFGPAQLSPNMQRPATLSALLRVGTLDPTKISAGSQPVYVTLSLPAGPTLSSGVLGVMLLPTVSSMTLSNLQAVSVSNPNVYGTVSISGQMLGTAQDYIEFCLVQNGTVVLLLDKIDPSFSLPADQSALRYVIPSGNAVPPGVYLGILRVNGAQARQPIALNMVAP